MNDDNVTSLGHRREPADTHQYATRDWLRNTGVSGATWKELAEATGMHHGSASGFLSNLHRLGEIKRLSQRRDGCKVYVYPEFVLGRVTEERRPVALVDQIYDVLRTMPQAALDAADPEWRQQRLTVLDRYVERRT